MALVIPRVFTAGRNFVMDGVRIVKGTVLTPTDISKIPYLNALVDRGYINVTPDPHQRRSKNPRKPHSTQTMLKVRKDAGT